MNEQLLGLPHPFDAVQVTVVVPKANVEPDAGVQTTVAAGSPVAVGVLNVATLLSHCVMLAGHEPITGAVQVVVTVIVFELADVLIASVARTR